MEENEESRKLREEYAQALDRGDAEKAKEVRDKLYDWNSEGYKEALDEVRRVDVELQRDMAQKL